MIPTRRSKETNKINASKVSIQQAKDRWHINHMTDQGLQSKLSWWNCSSPLPEYVSVSQHPFEALAVPHRSHFTNFSNSPPPVQKAIMQVYVVHVWKSLQSRTRGNKWKWYYCFRENRPNNIRYLYEDKRLFLCIYVYNFWLKYSNKCLFSQSL